MNNNNNRAEQRRAVLAQMDALLRRLHQLDLEENAERRRVPIPPNRTRNGDIVTTGTRIQILIQDQYHGRQGTILGPHGRRFWNIRLDRLPHEDRASTIHKLATSLEVIPHEP